MVRKSWIICSMLLVVCGLMLGFAEATMDQVRLILGITETEMLTQTSGLGSGESDLAEPPATPEGTPDVEMDVQGDSWMTILEIDDPVGDDHGPGTYLYPTHEQFAPYQGLLDIQKLKIEATEERVRFQVKFGVLTNPWNSPLGFTHQMIQLYIDHRPGGGTAPFLPGAKVVFSPKASWDSLVKVTGWGVKLIHSSDDPKEDVVPYTEAEVQILDDGQTIQVEMPVQGWTNYEDLSDGAYYLMVGAQDGFGPDDFRVVKEEVSEWYFGGGDGSGYGSNVIDIITPPGKSQQKILGSYDPNTHIFAVVEPVHRPNPVRKGIIYLISLGICLMIWFLWHRRDGFTRSQ